MPTPLCCQAGSRASIFLVIDAGFTPEKSPNDIQVCERYICADLATPLKNRTRPPL